MKVTAKLSGNARGAVLIGSIFLLVSFSAPVLGGQGIGSGEHPDRAGAATKTLRQDILEKGMNNCRSIDEKKYVTGLLFNGPGMHTYFERAYCYRELAVQERDVSLCRFVKQRRSLFFNGSQVSGAVCKQKVAAAIQGDKDKAFVLASQRDKIIESAEVVGILEYDKVTASRSLILRGKFKKLDWPYYQYEFEFQDQQGEVLARYTESPFAQNQNDRVFMFRMQTLEDGLAGHSLDDISVIAIRAVLQRHAASAHVMRYISFDQIDTFTIGSSAFRLIPLLGTIRHDQWLGLLERKREGTAVFLGELDKLTAP